MNPLATMILLFSEASDFLPYIPFRLHLSSLRSTMLKTYTKGPEKKNKNVDLSVKGIPNQLSVLSIREAKMFQYTAETRMTKKKMTAQRPF